MLKKIFVRAFIVSLVASSLSGCIVRTHNHNRGRARSGCGPAHHWDNGRCVHNGHGHGNGKGRGKGGVVVRDHR